MKNFKKAFSESYDLNHFRENQVTFGSKGVKAMGPQIWNCLPIELTSADTATVEKISIEKLRQSETGSNNGIIFP